MRIDRITLYNFGSYEGENIFDTNSASGCNIVLIGGKNGAGKTTLFTAMRVCLYGYMSMGYKNYNAFYIRAITKLINNTAKMLKPVDAGVTMQISLSNGRGLDQYELARSWQLTDSLSETFTVYKNGTSLSANEIADFEKYILSIIPPELFNLYFFDGEKIADFFMNEGSNSRIKDAFLTLCGYDTFDIMRRNFKRISNGTPESTASLDMYCNAKQHAEQSQRKHQSLLQELSECEDSLTNCEAEIVALEKAYQKSGGISQEAWNEKLIQIREEEKKRESLNSLLRKWANELIPFLIIRDQVVSLQDQISVENNNQKYRHFCEILETPEIKRLLGSNFGTAKSKAYNLYGSKDNHLLNLSLEQSASILSQINVILSFDSKKILKCKKAIKKSIALSAKLRQELDDSNVTAVQEYMKQRADLFERKAELLGHRVELEQALSAQKEVLQQAEVSLGKAQAKLEAELKKASINDISARAIVMLDKLQRILYRQQISKVESSFRAEIKLLMRKTRFIDDIRIDDNFNIFLYRHDAIPVSVIYDALKDQSEEHIIEVLGKEALYELYHLSGANTLNGITAFCATTEHNSLTLPVKVDQNALSNGEKQIFIMALYQSLVQLGRHEVPFIIDTPFARIDTEHRRNISKYFFSKLQGQVFILSTNEEINSDHIQIMKDRIAATYTLENADNKRTIVIRNSYFEV